jgi:hypothetical protein
MGGGDQGALGERERALEPRERQPLEGPRVLIASSPAAPDWRSSVVTTIFCATPSAPSIVLPSSLLLATEARITDLPRGEERGAGDAARRLLSRP